MGYTVRAFYISPIIADTFITMDIMPDEMHNADNFLSMHTWFDVTSVFLVLSYRSYFLFLIGVVCYYVIP